MNEYLVDDNANGDNVQSERRRRKSDNFVLDYPNPRFHAAIQYGR